MNNLLTKIKTWFKPEKPIKPKQPTYQPINHQHYRKLIGKIAKQAIAIQRKRRKTMTKARTAYIYQFKGTILGRQPKTASPHSKYAGQEYYNLQTVLENQPNKVIQVLKIN